MSIKKPVTNQDINEYCKEKFNFTAKSNYIAHAKEIFGIPVKRAGNRKGEKRLWPCPKDKIESFKTAFIDLGLLKEE